jgi:hypothetical protein
MLVAVGSWLPALPHMALQGRGDSKGELLTDLKLKARDPHLNAAAGEIALDSADNLYQRQVAAMGLGSPTSFQRHCLGFQVLDPRHYSWRWPLRFEATRGTRIDALADWGEVHTRRPGGQEKEVSLTSFSGALELQC